MTNISFSQHTNFPYLNMFHCALRRLKVRLKTTCNPRGKSHVPLGSQSCQREIVGYGFKFSAKGHPKPKRHPDPSDHFQQGLAPAFDLLLLLPFFGELKVIDWPLQKAATFGMAAGGNASTAASSSPKIICAKSRTPDSVGL